MTDASQDYVHDIAGAYEWLKGLNFDYSHRQVRRMAEQRKLPFHFGPCGRKLFIWHSKLEQAVKGSLPASAR